MKKLVSLVLAVMMVVLCTISLAETPEGYPKVVEGIDFGGATLYINPYWGPPARSENPNDDQKLEYAYKDWIMDTYNVKIVEEQLGDWGDNQVNEIQQIISAGAVDGEYRLFIMPPGFVGTPMSNGWFADWNNNELIDLSAEKWNAGIIDFMKKGNEVFGVATGAPEPRQCVFFNKKVLADAGIDWNTIYDMQKDGTWTWAAFENLCAQLTKDTDADGVYDVYGFTGNTTDLYLAAVFGNNGSFFDFDENGKLIVTAGSDNVTEALTWCQNLWNSYARKQTPEEAENNIWDFFKEAFKAGNCGFYVSQTYEGYNENALLANMTDEWGCVAFPKGPKGDDYVFVISDNIVVCPSIYDKTTTRNIQYIYDLWTNTAPGIDDSEAWIGLKYEICSDDRAVDETYAMLRESSHAKGDKSLYLGDNNKILGSNTYGNYLWGMLGDTPTALYEGIKPSWDALCAVFNGDMSQDELNKFLEDKAAEEAAAAETKAE